MDRLIDKTEQQELSWLPLSALFGRPTQQGAVNRGELVVGRGARDWPGRSSGAGPGQEIGRETKSTLSMHVGTCRADQGYGRPLL